MATNWLVPAVAQALLFLLQSGMAASVDTQILRERLTRWKGIMVGLVCQFFILPATGFCSAKAFSLQPVFGISLLAVTSSPGGAYSNWWCSVFNADLALSVAMTTCSTLASVVMMPANLALYTKAAYGSAPELDWLRLLTSIVVAVLAIGCGTCMSARFPRHRRSFNIFGNVAGIALIVFSFFTSSRDDPIWDKDLNFYTAVGAPCVVGLILAFTIGRLAPCISRPEAVAVTVETCYQNIGLALTIALASFEGADRARSAGVPLYYGFVQVVCLPVFLLFAWKAGLTHAPSSDRLYAVIIGDYQPQSPTSSDQNQLPSEPEGDPEATTVGDKQEEEDTLAERPVEPSPSLSPGRLISL
jgi:sodium/bile acid cotransporter 2